MLTSGDVVALDLAISSGREAGFGRPAVVVTAQHLLDGTPNVVRMILRLSANMFVPLSWEGLTRQLETSTR